MMNPKHSATPGLSGLSGSAPRADLPANAVTDATGTPEEAFAIAETRAWVARAVIGLNLCPFAKAAQARRRIRYACSSATDAEGLLEAFCAEVRLLLGAAPSDIETTVLVHPFVLGDFDDYNDFLDIADAALEALDATGIVQVASFHPHYRFEGTAPDDIGNATNRAPYPTLQLLREDSIDTATAAFRDSAAIYQANIATLQALGPAGWRALRAACRRDAQASREG